MTLLYRCYDCKQLKESPSVADIKLNYDVDEGGITILVCPNCRVWKDRNSLKNDSWRFNKRRK